MRPPAPTPWPGCSSAVRRTLAATVATILGGCHRAPPLTLPEVARSSVRFVTGPLPAGENAKPVEEPKSGDYFDDAKPIEPLALPVYPKPLHGKQAGTTTIGVRITVTRDGRVGDVGPSLLALTIPTRFEAEFRQAVDAALTQWRFQPALRRHFEISKDAAGEPVYHETDREAVESHFDVAFTFSSTGEVIVLPSAKK